jgi:hypothetical protein
MARAPRRRARAQETSTTVRYQLVASLRVDKYQSGNWYVWQKVG